MNIFSKLRPFFYTASGLAGLFLALPLIQTVSAHANPANHPINHNSCEGVLYRSTMWNLSSAATVLNEPVLSCPATTLEDSCGQFDEAVIYGDNFCATQTQTMRNLIQSSFLHTQYYTPDTIVNPPARINYTFSQGMEFSCNVCADTERAQFEVGNNIAKTSFETGEPIFFRWWSLSQYSNNLPYDSYTLSAYKRPLHTTGSYQYFATIANNSGSFAMLNLTNALYQHNNQHLSFAGCYEYEIEVTVQLANVNTPSKSRHHFTVYDPMLCPQVMDNAIPDREVEP